VRGHIRCAHADLEQRLGRQEDGGEDRAGEQHAGGDEAAGLESVEERTFRGGEKKSANLRASRSGIDPIPG